MGVLEDKSLLDKHQIICFFCRCKPWNHFHHDIKPKAGLDGIRIIVLSPFSQDIESSKRTQLLGNKLGSLEMKLKTQD